VIVDGSTWRTADGSGALGDGHVFTIASYRVRVAPAPPGAIASPPQRTESLARELVRALLGGDASPSLTIERGPHAGAKRVLPPPEGAVVIGRGDEAQWIVDDPDLSKLHLEIRRGWDGVRAVDLASKNGTRLDSRELPKGGAELRDGMVLELGNLALRYRDPAERHLASGDVVLGEPPRVAPAQVPRGATGVFVTALVVAALSLAALVYLLAR
jgi:hypothetical protein